VVQLLRRHSNVGALMSGAIDRQRGGLAPWQVRRSLEVIAAHLSEALTLDTMAREVGLSAYHFARAFRVSMGIAPHAYQVKTRIERAQRLLLSSSMSVTEIAFEVGYESSQALARSFRQQVGCSPSEFRRERLI
jgi:AraC family transcriptional regulator